MSTCARCGLPKFDWQNPNETPSPTCEAAQSFNDWRTVACRDRELTNLRSLLRSVMGKLEEAHGCLFDIDDPAAAITARNLI